ncbi:hypothetical protein M422DRAFT_70308 [Sphaerobolus stellatus SS14]|uniref:Unplaced genomic scaffold SPHSTscaffold_130, whole genome shotgun sequence n=1 Tax=Sphaerobolus stellatus (strain SS14) TaxID=990650 RepID=A0A0C9UGT7_SPHS4|nr:hypothetical protein M422DRAFT_70308 [Sphaerobolus stellatus SS14]
MSVLHICPWVPLYRQRVFNKQMVWSRDDLSLFVGKLDSALVSSQHTKLYYADYLLSDFTERTNKFSAISKSDVLSLLYSLSPRAELYCRSQNLDVYKSTICYFQEMYSVDLLLSLAGHGDWSIPVYISHPVVPLGMPWVGIPCLTQISNVVKLSCPSLYRKCIQLSIHVPRKTTTRLELARLLCDDVDEYSYSLEGKSTDSISEEMAMIDPANSITLDVSREALLGICMAFRYGADQKCLSDIIGDSHRAQKLFQILQAQAYNVN